MINHAEAAPASMADLVADAAVVQRVLDLDARTVELPRQSSVVVVDRVVLDGLIPDGGIPDGALALVAGLDSYGD